MITWHARAPQTAGSPHPALNRQTWVSPERAGALSRRMDLVIPAADLHGGRAKRSCRPCSYLSGLSGTARGRAGRRLSRGALADQEVAAQEGRGQAAPLT